MTLHVTTSAIWAITLDVRLECDGSNTCHWIYTRFYTGKSLNLLKIFIKVIESTCIEGNGNTKLKTYIKIIIDSLITKLLFCTIKL